MRSLGLAGILHRLQKEPPRALPAGKGPFRNFH